MRVLKERELTRPVQFINYKFMRTQKTKAAPEIVSENAIAA